MADIQMRFLKDMLVLSSPVSSTLARQGVEMNKDFGFVNLLEPETVREANRLELAAGAQCLVAHTSLMTDAQLRHLQMEDKAEELAKLQCEVAHLDKPQHVLIELTPCGLPLDPSSADSLKEYRNEYSRSAKWFLPYDIDAFFLNGFVDTITLKCALMGIRRVCDTPIFASVLLDAEGKLAKSGESLAEAVSVMEEYEASVVGFQSPVELRTQLDLVKRVREVCKLPVLVQLEVTKFNPKFGEATKDNPYYAPETMFEAAVALRAVGAQFLRAVGDARPSYTGVLVAASAGTDVVV